MFCFLVSSSALGSRTGQKDLSFEGHYALIFGEFVGGRGTCASVRWINAELTKKTQVLRIEMLNLL